MSALDLAAVAARMESSFAAGMKAQLQWLEDAALALSAEGHDATDFKAALGAVLVWSRGAQDAKTLPELEAVVRTFTTRGTIAMYRGLSTSLRELADARAGQRSLCLDLAGIFTALARAMERGQPPPLDALERLASARDALTSQTS